MRGRVWRYQGSAPWHFVSLPKKESVEIKKEFAKAARAWGSLAVLATIGKTKWATSVFRDKKSDTYLLPLKSEIRKKLEIAEGDTIDFCLEIQKT